MLTFVPEAREKSFIASIFCFYQSMPYLCFCTALQETALPVRTQMRKLPRCCNNGHNNNNNLQKQKQCLTTKV